MPGPTSASTAAAAAAAALASKAVGSVGQSCGAGAGRMGGMHLILLTAMTLAGFYLCLREIRRITEDVSDLRMQAANAMAAASEAVSISAASAAPGAKAPGGPPPMRDVLAGLMMTASVGRPVNAAAAARSVNPAAERYEEVCADVEAGADEEVTEDEDEVDADEDEDADVDVVDLSPESLGKMGVKDLRALLENYGVHTKPATKKSALVALALERLAGAEATPGEADGEGDE